MQQIPIEDDIVNINDDSKDDSRVNDYNDAIEEILKETYSEPEDARLFE